MNLSLFLATPVSRAVVEVSVEICTSLSVKAMLSIRTLNLFFVFFNMKMQNALSVFSNGYLLFNN